MSRVGVFKAARIRAICAACGKKGLNISEDERHDIQLQVIGKASLSDMSLEELNRLHDHLNQRAKPGNEWAFTFNLPESRRLYAQKIYRLAERVGKLQTPPVPVASKAYIEGITAQMRGATQPLEFCDPTQLHKVVQALEVYVKRHGV